MTTFKEILRQPGNLGAITVLIEYASYMPDERASKSLEMLFSYLKDYKQPPTTRIREVSLALYTLGKEASEPARSLAKLASLYFDALYPPQHPPKRLPLPTIETLSKISTEGDVKLFLTPSTMEHFLFDLDLASSPPRPLNKCREQQILPFDHSSARLTRAWEEKTYPLMECAAASNSPPCIRKLHAKGLSVNFPRPFQHDTSQMLPPVFSAAQNGCVDSIHTLNALHAQMDTPYPFEATKSGAIEWLTPLGLAAHHGKILSIDCLLELGAQPNSQIINRDQKLIKAESPLFRAVLANKRDAAQKICKDPRCNLNEKDKNGNSIGQVAAATGDVLMLLDLHNLGVDLSSNPGEQRATPILIACKNNHLGAVEYLAQKHPSTLELRDSLGRTPVIIATLNGNIPILRALKAAGANLSVKWKDGNRPVDRFEHDDDHQLRDFFISAAQKQVNHATSKI